MTDHLQKLQTQIVAKQEKIITGLPGESALDLLFKLAVLLEGCYEQDKENFTVLQQWTAGLGKQIGKVFQNRKWKKENDNTDQIQLRQLQQLHLKLLQGHKYTGLAQLLILEEYFNQLEELKDINFYDRSCNVMKTADDRLVTILLHEAGLRTDIKTQLKYKFLKTYYIMYGMVLVEQLIQIGHFEPKGKDEVDRYASRQTLAQEIAVQECLDHYGIEKVFRWHGVELDSTVLSRILSFLTYYFQARYWEPWELHQEEVFPDQKVFDLNIKLIDEGAKEVLGPLYLCSLDDLTTRLQECLFPSLDESVIRSHLEFFVQKLDQLGDELDLIQTLLLQHGDHIAIFVRPLMLQNGWYPLVQRLVGNPGDREEKRRVERAAHRLAKLFKDQKFAVIVEEPIKKADGKNDKTDIDLAAFKDGHLFLFQLKMTALKPRAGDYKSHLEDALKTAYRQNRKVHQHMQEHWPEYQLRFGTELSWEQIETHQVVVSTSLEGDRRPIFKESLKISQFELERYLKNDTHLMLDDDTMVRPSAFDKPLYESGELTGNHLWELIEKDALWSFLNEYAAAKDLGDYLPSFDPVNISRI